MPQKADAAGAAAGRVDPRRFRNALALVPTGVVIITAAPAGGDPLGMTMNSFASVSLDPPLVLFAIDRRARSLDAWRRAPGYAINVLAETQGRLSNQFAGPGPARWAGVAATLGLHGAPLLDGALARFECAAYACVDGGDHLIFVACVERLSANPASPPLVFHRGRYTSVGTNVGHAAETTPHAALLSWPLAMHY
jgi:flavin reductase (DIM6/NTAB) family NADH-FMN oxidoreductase RutF